MRIGYIAKHDQPNTNDDEGAITHALESLGHDVHRLRESKGHKAYLLKVDMILFHKWQDVSTLKSLDIPKVFWYFDLVDCNDLTLQSRCAVRRAWMKDILPHVDLGFCTDGDWVDGRHISTTGVTRKLRWLPQGVDERMLAVSPSKGRSIPLLFVGATNGGQLRKSFVAEMETRYGNAFVQLTRTHGERLAQTIAGTQIVVCPDGPSTDRYWSNRVYNMLGYGAFVLHPYCDRLVQSYPPGSMIFYENRKQLHEMIDHFTSRPLMRAEIAATGLEQTRLKHTYRHRCDELVKEVQRCLNLS